MAWGYGSARFLRERPDRCCYATAGGTPDKTDNRTESAAVVAGGYARHYSGGAADPRMAPSTLWLGWTRTRGGDHCLFRPGFFGWSDHFSGLVSGFLWPCSERLLDVSVCCLGCHALRPSRGLAYYQHNCGTSPAGHDAGSRAFL